MFFTFKSHRNGCGGIGSTLEVCYQNQTGLASKSPTRRRPMHRKFSLSLVAMVATSAILIVAYAASRNLSTAAAAQTETQGSLQVLDESGKPKALCPLKHTDVRVEISGFLSRVNVTQEFENPFTEKIEAVYTFPLPQNAAVDDMTMTVGDRTVRGKILRRDEAQA